MNQVEQPSVGQTGSGVLDRAQAFLANVEAWRQREAASADATWGPRIDDVLRKKEAAVMLVNQRQQIQSLRLGTLAEDPKVAARCRQQLDVALLGYHEGRAAMLGLRVTELAVESPWLSRIRELITVRRQTYHERKARQAAGRLIRAA